MVGQYSERHGIETLQLWIDVGIIIFGFHLHNDCDGRERFFISTSGEKLFRSKVLETIPLSLRATNI